MMHVPLAKLDPRMHYILMALVRRHNQLEVYNPDGHNEDQKRQIRKPFWQEVPIVEKKNKIKKKENLTILQ